MHSPRSRQNVNKYPEKSATKVVNSSVVVSIVSGEENGGHEGRKSHGRIFIKNRDPLDHRYQIA
jgi:hypothetical protein